MTPTKQILLGMVLGFWFIGICIYHAYNIPVAKFSYATGECVQVYSYHDYTCDDISEIKYEKVYVK